MIGVLSATHGQAATKPKAHTEERQAWSLKGTSLGESLRYLRKKYPGIPVLKRTIIMDYKSLGMKPVLISHDFNVKKPTDYVVEWYTDENGRKHIVHRLTFEYQSTDGSSLFLEQYGDQPKGWVKDRQSTLLHFITAQEKPNWSKVDCSNRHSFDIVSHDPHENGEYAVDSRFSYDGNLVMMTLLCHHKLERRDAELMLKRALNALKVERS